MNNQWKIQLEGKNRASNSTTWMNCLQFSPKNQKYMYDKQDSVSHFQIVYYSPIKFLINDDGKCKFTLNRLSLDMNNEVNTNFSS